MGTQSNDFFKGLMPLDSLGHRTTIDIVHAMIHAGKHFTTSRYEKLAAASALNILITAPATGQYHWVAEFGTDGPVLMTFSKAPDYDATGGTVLVGYNNDESASNDTALVHVANGSYVSSGTLLATYVVGGSSGNGAEKVVVGGDGASRYEWELAPSSVHLLRWVADLASCRTAIRTHYYKE
jgi:hypothetical protein